MYIEQTHSTSTLLREQYTDDLPHLYTIRTDFQTAGRGQAGNSWESEKGKNLLFSSLLRYDDLHASGQWRLSMLVAVALWDVLAQYLPQKDLSIKWPNDIYFGNKKLVGILLENILSGCNVKYSIVGIGVNVNQMKWLGNAPNPISMKQIVGKDFNVVEILNNWIVSIKYWERCSNDQIKKAYMQHLYRREGWFAYVEREVNLQPTVIANATVDGLFLAKIVDITQQGELLLQKQNGSELTYHFKQIRFVIDY